MEKLDKVIAGLTGCIVCNCSNCEYGGSKCTERLMKDALEVIGDLQEKLKTAKESRLELARRYRELEEMLPTMPNDWGEYPPEFPREGM